MDQIGEIIKRSLLDPFGLVIDKNDVVESDEENDEDEESKESSTQKNLVQAIKDGEYYPPPRYLRIILVVVSLLTIIFPPISIYLMLYATSIKEEVEKESYNKFLPSCLALVCITGICCFPLAVFCAVFVWVICIAFVPLIILTEKKLEDV